MSDACLLGKYLEDGSEAAFRSLVQRHLNLVYGATYRRLGNESWAQEAAQRVFILLARKAWLLRGRTDLSGWLYRTALLKAREILREESRRAERESQAARLGTTMNDSESLLEKLTGILDEALMDLREKDRQALLLRYFEEKSLREVGDALGVGEDAAQKRVSAAMEALTRAFRKRGYAAVGVGVAAAALRGGMQAAPSGLLTAATQAAVMQSAGASLFGLGLLLAKLMALTKTQTAALCVLIAAGPALWQWHALESARSRQEKFRETSRIAETELIQLRRDEGRLARRLTAEQEKSARLRSALARRQSASPSDSSALYRWSEESDLVRVPKRLLATVNLAEQRQPPPEQRSWEDTARPVLSKNGELSTSVSQALDLSTNQVEALRAALAQFTQEFEAVAKEHSVLTNAPPEKLGFYASGGPDGEAKTLYTTAFPEDGAALERQLHESLDALLGPERAGVFWAQALHDFNYRFNRFGKSAKAVTLVRYNSQTPPFYVRGQVAEGTDMEGESRNGFLYTDQPPDWAGFKRPLLPAEFRDWWPDLNQPSTPESHE